MAMRIQSEATRRVIASLDWQQMTLSEVTSAVSPGLENIY